MKSNTLIKHIKKYAVIFLAILISIALAMPATLSSTNLAWATPTIESVSAELAEQQVVLNQASNDYWEASQAQEAAQNQVDEANAKIDDANFKISEIGGKLGKRARDMYRNGVTSILEVIVGAATFRDLANNLDLLSKQNAKDAGMISESKALREEIENQKAILDENLAIANEKAAEAYRIKSNAESIQASLQSKLNQLNEEQRRAASEAALRQREQDDSGDVPGGGGGGGGSTPGDGGAIVARAASQAGKPYVWGAVGPDGYDCSGLVSYAVSGQHIRLGTTGTFLGWPRVSNPGPGCVAVNSGHCGIYIGGGQMWHAPQTGDVVRIGRVQAGMVYVSRG